MRSRKMTALSFGAAQNLSSIPAWVMRTMFVLPALTALDGQED